ncbi:restriction endonuclease subunit S [uncultured Treponema sp.]|uniref:restriction endonuclease subunit S n=1 Tax=uncultured Treponema sp. TaxID=162155 RepID=UPI0025915714|nr:restriction endonuclease subunit S [uncultured Treponema sp.]
MSEWKTVRLGDYITEYSVKNKSNEDIPVYSVTNTQGFCTEYFSKDVSSKDKSNYKIVPRGCFAYNPSRINVGSVDWQRYEDRVIVSPLYNVFKVSPELENQYLYYFLKSDIGHTLITSKAEGSVRDNLKITMLAEFSIPLPPLEEQKHIAAMLDKCTALVTKYKLMLEKYDTLIKSRFIEMFGDPKINSSNLPTKKFIEVVKLQRGFDLPVQERNQDGLFNVYGSNGPLDKHDSFKVKAPGIVTGRSGTLGNVYYVLEDYWPLNTTLFSVDIHNNNVVYLKYLLELYDLSRFSEGAGVPTLNRNIVHDKDIIDVPLSLQNDFAAFVQQIDKSKFAVQKLLEKAETLYKSLMQLYFA